MRVVPQKLKQRWLSDVAVGQIFLINGFHFIKLANQDFALSGIPATTLDSLCSITLYQNDNTSVEERAVQMFMEHSMDAKSRYILTSCLPDTDMFNMYRKQLAPISDNWYLDNGAEDITKSGEYFYASSNSELVLANQFQNIAQPSDNELHIRAMYGFEPFARVWIKS